MISSMLGVTRYNIPPQCYIQWYSSRTKATTSNKQQASIYSIKKYLPVVYYSS